MGHESRLNVKKISKKFSYFIKLSNKLFGRKLKKELILKTDGRAIFNTGAYRAENGEYYLFPRISTHHHNYPSWISLYRSNDGKNFNRAVEFFIHPPYTIEDYSYGCEDDRCSKIDDWFVHTHTLLLANEPDYPTRNNCTDYICLSLGKKADEAKIAGIIDIKRDKNACCIKISEKIHLIHRAFEWSTPPCIWYGDFSESFAGSINFCFTENEVHISLPKIKPSSKNRILLSPLKSWGAFKIGLGAPPLKISDNTFLFTYHVRAFPYQYWWSAGIMYEKNNQLKIKKLLPFPLCLPNSPWELIGDVPKVSFICGITKSGNTIEGWVGGADNWIIKTEIEFDYLNSVIEDYGMGEEEIDSTIKEYVRENKKKLMENNLIDKKWLKNML